MSLQVLFANKVLTANEVDGIEDGNELIKKCEKLSKTGKLFKSNEKLSKFKKSPALKHAFTLAFTNI